MQDFGSLIIMGPEMEDFDKGVETAYKRVLQLNGIPLDGLTDLIIKKIIEEQRGEVEEKLRNIGFPVNLLKLFSLQKKNDVKKNDQKNHLDQRRSL